jgi:hypothetical protein
MSVRALGQLASVLERIELPVGIGSTAAYQIARGDLCYWNATSSIVQAAANFTWATSDAATRRNFKRYFVGIALDDQRATDVARTMSFASIAEILADRTSATGVLTSLFGPDGNAATALLNQTIIAVQDPAEAIGETVRNDGAATDTGRISIRGQIGLRTELVGKKTKTIAVNAPAAANGYYLAATAAHKLFGGAVEILAIDFICGLIPTGNAANFRFVKNSTNFASDLQVLTNATLGGLTSLDCTAMTARTLDANDTLAIQQVTAPVTAMNGTILIQYRPLS